MYVNINLFGYQAIYETTQNTELIIIILVENFSDLNFNFRRCYIIYLWW